MAYKVEWQAKWPTEPGWYWFYGREFGERSAKSKLVPVDVYGPVRNSQGGESMIYVAGGAFLSRAEAEGMWVPMRIPRIPHEAP